MSPLKYCRSRDDPKLQHSESTAQLAEGGIVTRGFRHSSNLPAAVLIALEERRLRRALLRWMLKKPLNIHFLGKPFLFDLRIISRYGHLFFTCTISNQNSERKWMCRRPLIKKNSTSFPGQKLIIQAFSNSHGLRDIRFEKKKSKKKKNSLWWPNRVSSDLPLH